MHGSRKCRLHILVVPDNMAVRRTYGKRPAASQSQGGEGTQPASSASLHAEGPDSQSAADVLLEQIEAGFRKRQRGEFENALDDEDAGKHTKGARVVSAAGLRSAGKASLLLQDISYQLVRNSGPPGWTEHTSTLPQQQHALRRAPTPVFAHLLAASCAPPSPRALFVRPPPLCRTPCPPVPWTCSA